MCSKTIIHKHKKHHVSLCGILIENTENLSAPGRETSCKKCLKIIDSKRI